MHFFCLRTGYKPAAAVFRGALYVMDGTTPVPNSYYTPTYTYVAFKSVEYDTSRLMDTANYQQFVVPAGVSKVRLKCGFVWSASNPSLRTQMVITKNNLTVPGLNGYRGLTPHNQSDTGGTTTDFGLATHVLPVIPGDTFQCAAWQQQVTDAEISRDLVVASFSIEIVE